MRAIVVTLLAIGSNQVLANTDGHSDLCKANEMPVFQCKINDKLLSLCASKDFAKSKGTLQYRFGTTRKIELMYPVTPQPAQNHFFFSSAGYSGGGEAHIRFKNAEHEYVLFDKTIRTSFKGTNNPQFSSGIAIKHNGKTTIRKCSNEASIVSLAYEAIPEEDFQHLDQ